MEEQDRQRKSAADRAIINAQARLRAREDRDRREREEQKRRFDEYQRVQLQRERQREAVQHILAPRLFEDSRTGTNICQDNSRGHRVSLGPLESGSAR